MKKVYNYIVVGFFFCLLFLGSNVFGHSVQVAYCVSCEGVLRVYVEHWHFQETDPSGTTMDLEIDIGGNITTVSGSPNGLITDTVIGDLPFCATPLTVFSFCENLNPPAAPVCGNFLCEDGEDVTCSGDCPFGPPIAVGNCVANTCNYWVVFEFPGVQKGVPIIISVLSGSNAFTEEGCDDLFPAVSPSFVIPLSLESDAGPDQNICTGSTADLTLTNYTGTIQWQSSATSGGPWADVAGATAASYTTGALTTTTYYQALVTGDCEDAPSSEVAVIVTAGTPSDAGADISGCPSATPGNLGAAAVAGATYSWSPTTGLSSSTIANPTVDLSAIMNTVYTVSTTSPGCTPTTDDVTVVVSNNLAVTVNSPSLCFGESATLVASGADTYSWSPITALSATTGATVISTSAIDLAYTVTGTSNGCVGIAVSTVTVEPIPSSNAGADISICSGVTGTIGAPSTPGYVYDWLPATDLDDPNSANPSVTPTNFTGAPIDISYVVTTSPAGCFSTDEVIVTVNPSTDPTFSYTGSTFCQGGGGTDPSPTITAAGGTFTSSPVGLSIDGSTGLINVGASTIASYTVTYSHAGACPSSSTANVTITNIPDAQFSFTTYCQDETNPMPTFPAGSSAGIFSSTGGLVFANTATGEIDLAGSTAGNYTITNTIAAGGGCPNATSDNTVTINAIPVTTVDNATICDGETATLTAGGATTYAWSDASTLGTLSVSPTTTTPYTVTGTTAGCSSTAAGQITVNAIPTTTVTDGSVCDGTPATIDAAGADTYAWSDGSTATSLTISPSTTTTYTVTGTSLGCFSSAVSTVSVNPIPVVGVNSPVICQGNVATMTPTGADSYAWSDGSTDPTLAVSPSTTTSYTVTGTSLGCSASATASVTITLLPVVIVNSPAICIGDAATLNASGGSTYDWQTGESGNSITVSPTITTTYNVADNTPGCSGSSVSTVTVNPLPIVTVNSEVLCEGETATLTASGASTYAWDDGTTVNPKSITPTNAATYTVTGTSAAGCVETAVSTVTVNPLPIITVNETSVCVGVSSTLTASGALTYAWDNGILTAAMTDAPTSTSVYTVTGTDINNCTNTGSGTINTFMTPVAAFTFSPKPTGYYDPIIKFSDQSSGNVTYWYWDFGTSDTLAPDTQNPIYTYPSDTASYLVKLIVHNAGDCYDSISKLVTIGPEYSFFIPNAFSPNEDGINDSFFGKGEGILEYKLTIYDRWGNFIFLSDDISVGWDGKANDGADLAQQDIYIWKVYTLDIYHKKHYYMGVITIAKGD